MAPYIRLMAGLSLLTLGCTALADEIAIPSEGKSAEESAAPVITASASPSKGMTMDVVEKQFGPPAEKLAPVGEPPITRWVYGDYTVYFEGRYVIHAVKRK